VGGSAGGAGGAGVASGCGGSPFKLNGSSSAAGNHSETLNARTSAASKRPPAQAFSVFTVEQPIRRTLPAVPFLRQSNAAVPVKPGTYALHPIQPCAGSQSSPSTARNRSLYSLRFQWSITVYRNQKMRLTQSANVLFNSTPRSKSILQPQSCPSFPALRRCKIVACTGPHAPTKNIGNNLLIRFI
jgi:hypothetical protein